MIKTCCKIVLLIKCRNLLIKPIVPKITNYRLFATENKLKNAKNLSPSPIDYHDLTKSALYKNRNNAETEVVYPQTSNTVNIGGLKRTIELLIPRFRSLKNSRKLFSLSRLNPLKSKSSAPASSRSNPFKLKTAISLGSYNPLNLIRRRKQPLGVRIKTAISRFLFKSLILAVVLYAYRYYHVWGSVENSVTLYSTIRAKLYGDEVDAGPLDSERVISKATHKYNETIRWIVHLLITFPDIALCYIDAAIINIWKLTKQQYDKFQKKW